MKSNSYRVQDGCWNCKKVFVRSEYDEEREYFCHVDKSERPPCGSVAMEECYCYSPGGEYTFKKYDRLEKKSRRRFYRRWEEWAGPRHVKKFGICDEHVQSIAPEDVGYFD